VVTRRTATVTTAVALLVVLVCVAFLLPVPYVTLKPGPTRDVLALGKGGAAVISIEGAETYASDGALRLTTVSVTSPDETVGIGEAVQAWISPDEAVVPREAIYPTEQAAERSEQQSAAQMADSQEVAATAALRLLGRAVPEHLEVLSVTQGDPADGVLAVGDVIVAVDGTRTSGSQQTAAAIRNREVGAEVRLTVRRDEGVRTVSLQTVAGEPTSDDAEPYPAIGIGLGTTYDLPVEVQIELGGSIGGPSAGSIFALAIYDALTPGSLTGGASVAGTGVITADGAVGAIGGIQQKLAGAAEAGAEVFLVPAANCADAVGADIDEADIQLVEVDDLRGAVNALELLAADPEAEVATCG